MMFTALHRVLGREPGPLDWGMIEQAVADRVTEQADLDWKRSHYSASNRDEFAKDVAAMANTGGGLIVIGVQEDATTSAAREIVGESELDDKGERELRALIYSRTFPPVQGVSFIRLDDGDNKAALVISVPPSVEAPHLVQPQQHFGAPFRDGTRTEWMRERQLAAAYRQRFTARADMTRSIDELYRQTCEKSPYDRRVCFIAVTQPDVARPAALGRISQSQARTIFEYATALRTRILKGDLTSPLGDPGAEGAILNPRRDLRRMTARFGTEDGNPKHRSTTVSVHDSGAVSLAWSLGGMLPQAVDEPNHVTSALVETAVGDFLALVAATSRELGITSVVNLRVGLAWGGSPTPVVIHLPDYTMEFHDQPADASVPVRSFTTVGMAIDGQSDDATILECARETALDCVSQGGVQVLKRLRSQ